MEVFSIKSRVLKIFSIGIILAIILSAQSVITYRAGQSIDLSGASSVKVPTASPGDNSTNAASTAFVTAAGSGAKITSGTFASLPGTCTHTSTASDLYFTTDAPYTFVCTATNTQTPFLNGVMGKQVVIPPTASWTWDNQGSSTLVTTQGYLSFHMLADSAVHSRWYYRNTPVSPGTAYTVTFLFSASNALNLSLNQNGGWEIGFRDGTGVGLTMILGSLGSGNCGNLIASWTTSTSGESNVQSKTTNLPGVCTTVFNNPIWLALKDTGTGGNILFYWSIDGTNWIQVFSESRTTHFGSGPTQILVGSYSNDVVVDMNVLSMNTAATSP